MVERLRSCGYAQRVGVVAALTLAAIIFALVLPPIPQPPEYHRFADQRTWLGIPNFLNVVSNLPLALAGALGLWLLARREVAAAWRGFFLGVLLTGIGSAWYHWAPDNARLVWDRLPMTLCFMSLLAALIGERIGARAGRLSWLPLVALGMLSVLYWHVTESSGSGDLRPYGLVQFLTLLLVPVLVALFPGRSRRDDRDILVALALYVLALLCDTLLDARILALGGIVGGHALKHLLVAVAVLQLLVMLRRRQGSLQSLVFR